jgi:indolepyruvate ferredoxin oxidoreductase beta subunit
MLRARAGVPPVLALMPAPGDVDIVLSAELMEGGRSMLRGLVTPGRTTLIMSTHRAYAIVEKEKPGEGIGDPEAVTEAAGVAAKRTIAFDMEALATANGSVISASMFGALAGSESLPFTRQAFEDVIKAGGKGIDASLKAFGAAYEKARGKPVEKLARIPEKHWESLPMPSGQPELDDLLVRIRNEFPQALRPMVYTGVKRLTAFQDAAYADEYLDRLLRILGKDSAARSYAATGAAAKYLAKAMNYDDVIGVADIKTQAARFMRVRQEIGAAPDAIVYMTEFMHPRSQEIVGLLPKGLGEWIERRPQWMRTIDRLVNKGRRVNTGTIFWFLVLYGVSALRPWRRKLLRHSDTHARGLSKFDRVLSAVPGLAPRQDGAVWLERLIKAALLDEEGHALDGALKTVATL